MRQFRLVEDNDCTVILDNRAQTQLNLPWQCLYCHAMQLSPVFMGFTA
jgi:hypothetical protein